MCIRDSDNPNIPSKIMIKEEIEDKEAIEQCLSTELGKKVEIKTPKDVYKRQQLIQHALQFHKLLYIFY